MGMAFCSRGGHLSLVAQGGTSYQIYTNIERQDRGALYIQGSLLGPYVPPAAARRSHGTTRSEIIQHVVPQSVCCWHKHHTAAATAAVLCDPWWVLQSCPVTAYHCDTWKHADRKTRNSLYICRRSLKSQFSLFEVGFFSPRVGSAPFCVDVQSILSPRG